MRGSCWTLERVELLRRLWTEGKTAAAIGACLGGLSRSAVLGKVFRLRLPESDRSWAKQAAANEQSGKADPPARRRRSPKRDRPAQSPPAPAANTRRKTLLELTNNTCRWPHGRPGTEKFLFCGKPEADLERGIPYCARHMKRAYSVGVGFVENRTARADRRALPAAVAP